MFSTTVDDIVDTSSQVPTEHLRGGRNAVTDPDRLWDHCAASLRSRMGEATWLAWFDGVRLASTDGSTVTLSVPASVMKERIEARYLPLVTEELSNLTGSALDVRLVVATEERGLVEDGAPADGGEFNAADTARSVTVKASGAATFDLNPAYTFDAFVTGPSNRFAEAAAQAVAEMPGSAYNPLFIYGGSGLGKTHLLHAIGNYVRAHFPQRRVLYVPTETFLNQFIYSMRTKAQADFKQYYRVCDVLLFDDVYLLE
ncbi:MAG: DnaA ATPase domain-containing protein, partial [Acidimicrobiales bacterium]